MYALSHLLKYTNEITKGAKYWKYKTVYVSVKHWQTELFKNKTDNADAEKTNIEVKKNIAGQKEVKTRKGKYKWLFNK